MVVRKLKSSLVSNTTYPSNRGVSSIEQLRHVRLNNVVELVDVGERTWLRWVADGKAPRPVQLGENSVAWRMSDLRVWLESRPLTGSAEL